MAVLLVVLVAVEVEVLTKKEVMKQCVTALVSVARSVSWSALQRALLDSTMGRSLQAASPAHLDTSEQY